MSTVGARDVTRDRRRRHSHHGGRQRQPPELQGGHPRRRSLVSATATLVLCAQHALPLSHHLTLFNYQSTYIHHFITVEVSNYCNILYTQIITRYVYRIDLHTHYLLLLKWHTTFTTTNTSELKYIILLTVILKYTVKYILVYLLIKQKIMTAVICVMFT